MNDWNAENRAQLTMHVCIHKGENIYIVTSCFELDLTMQNL